VKTRSEPSIGAQVRLLVSWSAWQLMSSALIGTIKVVSLCFECAKLPNYKGRA
jgi:hypothetical protein